MSKKKSTKKSKPTGRKPKREYVLLRKAMETVAQGKQERAIYRIPRSVSHKRAKYRIQFFLKGDVPKPPRGKGWRSDAISTKGMISIFLGKARKSAGR